MAYTRGVVESTVLKEPVVVVVVVVVWGVVIQSSAKRHQLSRMSLDVFVLFVTGGWSTASLTF